MIILVKYGEIILKGLNRPLFEAKLVENIRRVCGDAMEITRMQAVIYVRPMDGSSDNVEEAAKKISKIFGVVYVIVAHEAEKNIEAIKATAKDVCANLVGSFKVEARRSDKSFPLASPQICGEVGGFLDDELPALSVDVNNPEHVVMVEIREEKAYIYTEKIAGTGGLPTGTGGKAALLLSGGIDSPVAGYMMAKRGVVLHAVHFFSYPYTGLRAKEKVVELARILSEYCGEVQLHMVPFTEIQLQINQKCPLEQSTIIMRRFMVQIADRIAQKNGIDALITGESLAQVASQTIQSIKVTDCVTELPIFRPLIGMDKSEIIAIARKIGTFDTSILPYEDCCTVFSPKHPNTKPKLEKIQHSQARLETEALIDAAMKEVETLCIRK
ncbi:MAG: tRNA 4-thiouridine(8) synthase ThiI [Clostridiales bacterium]|nr:tRNA 4-thiouridine(8) synthase ThiI [Clostridiales bacterium]